MDNRGPNTLAHSIPNALANGLREAAQKLVEDPQPHLPPKPTEINIINLETLEKIYRVLEASNSQEDQELVTWICENYLEYPIEPDEKWRGITTEEGFRVLLVSWKRAKKLSNGACEKWPFFTGTGAKMLQKTVKEKGNWSSHFNADSAGSQSTESAASQENADFGIISAERQGNHKPDLVTDADIVAVAFPNTPQDDASFADYELTPGLSAILSDPLPTSLDLLPPGSNKRKTTSFVGQSKKPKRGSASGRGRGRGRGSRGGRGGYTRKHKGEELVASDSEGEDAFDEPVDVQESVETPLVEEPRGARRSSRFTTSLHSQDMRKQPTYGVQAGIESGEDTNTHGLEKQNNVSLHRRMPGAFMQAPTYTDDELARRGLQRSAQPPQTYQTPNNVQNTTTGTAAYTPQAIAAPTTGVKYFARVPTASGELTVELPESCFKDGQTDLLNRYVEWKKQEDEGTDLKYDQFVKVIGFASKH